MPSDGTLRAADSSPTQRPQERVLGHPSGERATVRQAEHVNAAQVASLPRCTGTGAVLRGRAGAEGPRRAEDDRRGGHVGCVPGQWRGRAATLRLELQHHALFGGPRAGDRCALAVGNPRCSTIALTLPAPSRTPTPAACLHTSSTPTLPGRTSCAAARPSPNGVCAPSSAPPPSRQRRGSPP